MPSVISPIERGRKTRYSALQPETDGDQHKVSH